MTHRPAYCGREPGGGRRPSSWHCSPSSSAGVGREESVVRWDGEREQIVVRLTVGGDAERVAWIMPVPRRATVRLGDPAPFDELHTVAAPAHRVRYHFWPREGDWPLVSGDDSAGASGPPPRGPGAPVDVVGRQRLGPFEVARLTGNRPPRPGLLTGQPRLRPAVPPDRRPAAVRRKTLGVRGREADPADRRHRADRRPGPAAPDLPR